MLNCWFSLSSYLIRRTFCFSKTVRMASARILMGTKFVSNMTTSRGESSYVNAGLHYFRALLTFRHHASYIYIGQTYRSSPQYSFYIFSQKIYLIIFLDFLSPSSYIPPHVLYFLMLPFLVHKIFTLYINGMLNCKCPAPGPKG